MSRGDVNALLPSDALAGVRLGISVSESPDLLRLGLLEDHFRLALGEISRCILVSGGHLAYGGHLQSQGYTAFLIQELDRYSRRDRPLRVCLAWIEHRKMPLSLLQTAKQDLGLNGEIVCLDASGKVINPSDERGETPPPEPDEQLRWQSLTGLRRYMAEQTQGRVMIGGKRRDFLGEMPGLLEEALCSVEAGQPLYLAGGFGGITLDIACELRIDDGKWLPPIPDHPRDDRIAKALARLVEAVRKTGAKSLDNGLTADECRRLAACHRPSEIAALVGLGLGRKFKRQAPA